MALSRIIIATGLVVAASCGARDDLRAGVGGAGGTGGAAPGTGGAGAGGAPPSACVTGGVPVRLTSGHDDVVAIAVDASDVYFVTWKSDPCAPDARVLRVPKSGGDVAVVGQPVRGPVALAVDAERAYWFDDMVSPCTQPADPGYALMAAPKAGGPTLASPFGGQFAPTFDIALDATHVYWVADEANAVWRAQKGGGAPEVLAASADGPLAIAVDDTRVFWISSKGVRSAAKAGGTITDIASPPPQGGFDDLAVDASDVYVVGHATCQGMDCNQIGSVARVPAGGGAMTALVSAPDQVPFRIALADDRVYWTEQHAGAAPVVEGRIMRASKAGVGAAPVALAKEPRALAVDEACVYWSDLADGGIWKAPR